MAEGAVVEAGCLDSSVESEEVSSASAHGFLVEPEGDIALLLWRCEHALVSVNSGAVLVKPVPVCVRAHICAGREM